MVKLLVLTYGADPESYAVRKNEFPVIVRPPPRVIKSGGSRSGPKSLCAVETRACPSHSLFCSPSVLWLLQLCSWLLLQKICVLLPSPDSLLRGDFSQDQPRQTRLSSEVGRGQAPTEVFSLMWAPVESKEATETFTPYIFVAHACLAFLMTVTHFASRMP